MPPRSAGTHQTISQRASSPAHPLSVHRQTQSVVSRGSGAARPTRVPGSLCHTHTHSLSLSLRRDGRIRVIWSLGSFTSASAYLLVWVVVQLMDRPQQGFITLLLCRRHRDGGPSLSPPPADLKDELEIRKSPSLNRAAALGLSRAWQRLAYLANLQVWSPRTPRGFSG